MNPTISHRIILYNNLFGELLNLIYVYILVFEMEVASLAGPIVVVVVPVYATLILDM